jgi:uncharacterized C2H2 Zn-finger protein
LLENERAYADRPTSAFTFPHHDDHEQPMKLRQCLTTKSEVKFDSTAINNDSSPLEDNNTSVARSFQTTPKFTNVTAISTPHAKDVANICDERNCHYKGAFKSPYELARHTQTLHGGTSAKRFICGALGCFRGQQPWSFARADKLTSHIKATHNYNTVFNQCPVVTCTYGPCTLEVLGVHIQHAHYGLEEGRAVFNATPCKTRRCPLWRCGKHIATDGFMAHIITHASEDIEPAKSSLDLEGFFVETTPQHKITVHVVCPVCEFVLLDTKQFARHLADDHLHASNSGGIVHFEKWKAYWEKNAQKFRSQVKELLPWSRIRDISTYSHKRDYQCPCCPFSVMGAGRWFEDSQDQRDKRTLIREHHLSLLRPEAEVVAELYPHRMAILRICPGFVTHPVFADFDQLPQQSGSGRPEREALHASRLGDNFGLTQRTAGDFNVST